MEQLGIDYKLMLAQIVNFAIVFFLVRKFVATPFLGFLKKEKSNQEEKDKTESLVKQQKEELVQEENKLKGRWKQEAKVLLKQAEEEAEKKRVMLVKEAQAEAEEIRNKARRQIEEERKSAEKEMRGKVIDLALTMVDKGLNDYLDSQAQKEVTQYIIKNFTPKRIRG